MADPPAASVGAPLSQCLLDIANERFGCFDEPVLVWLQLLLAEST